MSSEQIIDQTKRWIVDVVIGCNLCSFAAHVVKQGTIFYKVETSIDQTDCLDSFLYEMDRLDNDETIETGFLIFPNTFGELDEYLDLLSRAEKSVKEQGNEGVYQAASFHPLYLFAGSDENDAANYTNRSIYPCFICCVRKALTRLCSITKSRRIFLDATLISQGGGLIYMKMLRDSL